MLNQMKLLHSSNSVILSETILLMHARNTNAVIYANRCN